MVSIRPIVLVDRLLDSQQQVRGTLDFIDDGPPVEAANEAGRVGLGGLKDRLIVEGVSKLYKRFWKRRSSLSTSGAGQKNLDFFQPFSLSVGHGHADDDDHHGHHGDGDGYTERSTGPILSQDRTWDSHQNELTLDFGYFRFRNTGLFRKLRP